MDNNTQHNNKSKISRWGVSPKIVLTFTPFAVFFGILHLIFYPTFAIPVRNIYMIILGIPFIMIGLIIYLKTIRVINEAYSQSKLLTSGVYAYMRHPLYSAFALFIIPGIVFLFNSWILFFIPLSYYIIARMYIKEEEKYCLHKFGKNYEHYKKHVFAFLPKLKKYKPPPKN
ncbi:MAG: isoprenylcysteine carboxylmethyltransferase family protein [Promethearchaeota archaeon]|nr:MAG: isoprenylcysteine carboxylmethyltransferase family protein [Candidatus Lokiarchaeota archaeon]